MKRLALLILALMMALPPSLTAFAIGNPDTVAFGSSVKHEYNVFNNILENGDWLIAAEAYVKYTSTPTDYTSKEAFLFELLDTTGTSVIVATPISAYGDRPIGIYLTKAQADNLTLTSGSGYILRITGNPAIFASTTNNTVSVTLVPTDYIDMTNASNSIPSSNELRNFGIRIATNMQVTDVATYISTVSGSDYLNSTGGNLFLQGIPGLNTLCPILFSSTTSTIIAGTPIASNNTGNYSGSLTIQGNWGTTTANGLTAMGLWLGFPQSTAAALVYFLLVIAFGLFFLYPKLQNGMAVAFVLSISPFIGTYLGFIHMAIVFDFVIFVLVIATYYFISRAL